MNDTDRSTTLPTAASRYAPGARLLALAAAVLSMAGVSTTCATNPATGETQLALIGTQEEIRMGKQTAEQVRSTMGLYEGEGLASYVSDVGLTMARDSERPDLPWSFAIADEPVVNAFALPGGFIYLTRGIMAYFNSEAEMAAVLGHEIGHVTARHSVEQMSQQQLAQLGLGIGAVLSEEVRDLSGLIGAGLGVLFMKFSRDDERQADRLGFQYMLSHGYRPQEMVDVFQMFRRQEAAAGGGGVPNWLSTHPTPADRIEEIRQMIDSVSNQQVSGTRVEREAYLQHIEGMVYGPDPRHGFFQGDVFVHPELEIQIEFPGGWQRRNMAQMVAAVSPEQDAQVQMTLADASTPDQAAQNFAGSQGVEPLGSQRTEIHGFPAVVVEFRASTQQTPLRGLAGFISDGSAVYSLVTFAAEQTYSQRSGDFQRFIGSFERMTDPEVLDAEPLRIELVTPDGETTIAELADDRGGPVSAEQLALINGLEVDERIPAGHTVKWVTGELPEGMREQRPQ